MSNVILFQPKSQHDAKANLADFIEFAKGLKPLGVDQPFESNEWAAGRPVFFREGNKKSFLRFTQLLEIDGNLQNGNQSRSLLKLMDEPFLSFAKALICYRFSIVSNSTITMYLHALRHMYRALLKLTGSLCPSGITPDVLNLTCQSFTEIYKFPREIGKTLESIYAMMVEFNLVSIPTVWKTIIPFDYKSLKRSGKEFDAARYKKLPSPLALEALAHIFNNPKDNSDIAVTSVCAILLSNPARIVEVTSGPLDCIAMEEVSVKGKALPGLCLRWYPAKKGDPLLKPVIPSMAEVARRAIKNLQKLGAPARELALWYENNPTKIYLPPHMEHLRSKPLLSYLDLNAILFDSKRLIQSMGTWIKRTMPQYGSKVGSRKRSDLAYIPFADLEKVILSMLPVGFPVLNPIIGVKYSEALCIVRAAELTGYPPYLCVLQPITSGRICHSLNGSGGFPSIFDIHGWTDEKGDSLAIRSHMFRHYLTMVGKAGGLSDMESNKWAGRANAAHMRTYNNISDRDILATIRNAVALNKPELGPLANMDNRMFISRAEFANIRVISAHTTDLGHCVHDFATFPCQLHGDHINCNEHVVIKGELEQENNLRCLQAETCTLLEKAKTAMSEGEYGASMWVDDHTKKLERVNQIIQFLDDPNTPNGAVIQASGIEPASRIKQAMEGRLQTSGKPLIWESIESLSDVHAILENQVTAAGSTHD
jgi:hypothetical protein